MKGRILTLVHGYPPAARTGAEIQAARTAIALHGRGFDSRVFTLEPGDEAHTAVRWHDEMQDAVLVRRVTGDLQGQQNECRASFDNQIVGTALADTLREWLPNLVYFYSGYRLSASVIRTARQAGIPVVMNLTDYWWFCHRVNLLRTDGGLCDGPSDAGCARCYAEQRRRWKLPAHAWPAAATAFWRLAPCVKGLDGWLGLDAQRERSTTLVSLLQEASALVAPSEFLADFYVRHGVHRRLIRLIRQGLDLAWCPLRVPARHLRFAFLGQVKAHKGVDLLLDAWARLAGPRPRTLVLYGTAAGEEAFGERVRETINKLPDAEWRGAYRAGEVWSRLAEVDVVVIPSRWVENSPNVILEAQAMAIPLVGSAIGGIAELVRHEVNGLLFEVNDAADLARQLQRLLDEPDLLCRLSRQALPLRTTEDELDDIIRVFGEFLPA